MVVYYCISLLHRLQLRLQSYIFLSMSLPRRLNWRSPFNRFRNEPIATLRNDQAVCVNVFITLCTLERDLRFPPTLIPR